MVKVVIPLRQNVGYGLLSLCGSEIDYRFLLIHKGKIICFEYDWLMKPFVHYVYVKTLSILVIQVPEISVENCSR
jgi:hypothetical protein